MMTRKCYICGEEMKETSSEIETGWGKYTLTIKGVNVHECPKCGEKVYARDEVNMIQNLSKSLSMTNEKPDVLNVEEVSDLLRVSTQTIYNMIKDGRLLASKVGREWRFNRKEIGKFLEPQAIAARGTISKGDIDIVNSLLGE